jgi:hypothetical protein
MPARLPEPVLEHLIADQLVGAADINFLINAVIAWALFRHLPTVPLWGAQSIMVDTLWTAFLLPFITCLIVNPLEHLAVRRGGLPRVRWLRPARPFVRFMPRATLLRAAVFGLAVTLVVPWVVWLVLWLLGVSEFSFWGFWAFKGLFAAGLAALVTPVISIYGLADQITSSR